MIYRKTSLAIGIVAAVFTVASASAAVLQSSHAGSAMQPIFPAPNGGEVVLYDQTDSAGLNGFPVQNFEASFDAYDSEGAEDFVVPASGWTVSSVNMVTTVGTPFTTTASVNFYPDAAGLPGAAATCSYAGVPAEVTATNTAITLPAGCVLAAGTYWVGVSVDVDFGSNGQIFWSTRTVQSNSPAAFRNPGDGFASGCTDWGAAAAGCGVGGGVDPDALFQILGTAGGGDIPAAPARELPTLSQWGILMGAMGLGLLGLLRVRRRNQN